MTRRSQISLQLKLAAALVVIVMVPLAASVYFIGALGEAAANVATGEASARLGVLERSAEVYRTYIFTSKRLQTEMATRLARRADLLALDPAQAGAIFVEQFAIDLTPVLGQLIEDPDQAGLRAIAILRPDGSVFAEAAKPATGATWRDKVVDEPLGDSATLRLTFEVPDVTQDLDDLKRTMDAIKQFVQIKTALPDSYRIAFIVLIVLAGVLAAGLGIWFSSRITRRITALVATARRVSDGQVDARVELRGRDEMAELGSAFNTMLDDLDETRKQVEYLQRMGVWQDVARRLAHEIKNPLTPIQLAVQQCASQYKGDDPRFKKLLVDTAEIVLEEIEGLRRLVDTFRTLGALPRVEAAPLALAELIEELRLDPAMATRLTLAPPPAPVTVRADKLLLKRVLVNLVENGIQAGQEAGAAGGVTVGWSADPRGDTVSITVDDHGKGVAPADRAKIFEPYVTTKTTGTGLGLAIARKIAIEHGGELAVSPDRAPTGGARFVVTLPLRGAESSLA